MMPLYKTTPYWRSKSLEEMTHAEWEALCDGCGKCCMIRLQDEDGGTVEDTNVACRLFDGESCRCTDYAHRCTRVPDCVRLTPDTLASLDWMPRTCAYRLIHEGYDLPPWHPLVSGRQDSIHEAGMSVRGRTISELEIDPGEIEHYLVEWPEPGDA